jgi:hypothetical protein
MIAMKAEASTKIINHPIVHRKMPCRQLALSVGAADSRARVLQAVRVRGRPGRYVPIPPERQAGRHPVLSGRVALPTLPALPHSVWKVSSLTRVLVIGLLGNENKAKFEAGPGYFGCRCSVRGRRLAYFCQGKRVSLLPGLRQNVQFLSWPLSSAAPGSSSSRLACDAGNFRQAVAMPKS